MRLQLLLLSLHWPAIVGVEVKSLPGLTEPLNFRHYSGYLTASPTHRLHYWFTESQRNPASDPVILWLNGGPGCSSLAGLLTENGPFHIRPDGKTLYLNPHSWNKIANVLFLESPAGVGFSYFIEDDQIANGPFTAMGNFFIRLFQKLDEGLWDDQTAGANYAALRDFYRQFPQFRNNSLYLMGESYGGVFVSTLVARVIQGLKEFPLNIKGIAVGNGELGMEGDDFDWTKFAYYHGLIDETQWRQLEADCCNGSMNTCDFEKAVYTSAECMHLMSEVTNILHHLVNEGLNIYDIYASCYQPSIIHNRTTLDATGHLLRLKGITPCMGDTSLAVYLNQKKVRRALGIPKHVTNWTVCNESIFHEYHGEAADQSENIRKALHAGLRVLIYSGDTDLVCNFLNGQKFCHNLGAPLRQGKRPWKVGNQIAGFVTRYRNLDFLTVKGAGHMVPTSKPKEAFHMISAFLNNETY